MEHHNTGGNSLIGFILTLAQLVAGISVATWDIPVNVIHCFQLGAFCGAIITAAISVLNYCGIKLFKKKK